MKSKVLMIDIGGWGGITHYTYNLMQALSNQKDTECVLLTDRDYELESFPRSFRIVKVPLKGQPYCAAVSRIIRVILAERPHLIHVQTMVTARRDWVLFILAKLFGLRVVFTAHNVLPHEDYEKRAFFMKNAFRIIYKGSARIIVHSEFSRNSLSSGFKIATKKISVIPHGNYLFFRTRELSRQQARQELSLPEDAMIILQFGALREYKGIDVLLEAFRKVRHRRGDAFLLLVGKPMHLDVGMIFEAIDRLGLRDAVSVKAEYVDFAQVERYFFAADAVVFPYKEIDMSGSLQLAYAFSKPVVAARSGGLVEVIEEPTNGYLFEPGDSAALAERIVTILEDEAARKKMGEASLRIAKEKFSWERIAAATADVYRSVWSEKR